MGDTSGLRPASLTAQRIVAAAESGKHKNMAFIARAVGVSRERVRQVLNAAGHTNFGPRHVRLQWSCPDCGKTIDMGASQMPVHMPKHCRDCAKTYCRGGHLLSKHAPEGRCRVCKSIQRRRIVEVRTCKECGKDLEISLGMRYSIRRGNARGDFHRECYFAYMRREGRPRTAGASLTALATQPNSTSA